jgi:hypothetical protein
MSQAEAAAPVNWQRLQGWLLAAAGAGAGLCALGLAIDLRRFLGAYLFAYLFWLGIALGCAAILMLQNLTGGRWGALLRRLLEAAAATLPLLGLLFVPLALGVYEIYPWAGPAAPGDHALRHKQAYLNVPFFLARAAVYFIGWIAVAFLLNRWSHAQEAGPDPELARRSQALSGPGLLVYGLGVTFASIDWVMSLDPHWHSTIFGVLLAVSQGLPALAFAILVLALLARRGPLADFVTPGLWHDLGNLLLAFVMIFSYISFSQFLLIWSGNLPEEITWYRDRAHGGWEVVAWLIALFSFAVPFFALLMRGVKRDPRRLVYVAAVVFVMGVVNQLWLVAPTFEAHSGAAHGSHADHWPWLWLDAAALCAVGGLWLALFFRALRARPLLPRPEPIWEEAEHHG